MQAVLVEKIRHLLQPTYDEQGWYREVMALEKAEAIPILIGVLTNEQESLEERRQSALILGLLRDERAIEPLAGILNAAVDRSLRGYAADALGQFTELPSDHVHLLIEALKDEEAFVRERSAKALERLQRQEALPALEQMQVADNVLVNRLTAEEAIKAIKGLS